jgi:hypothetical protein
MDFSPRRDSPFSWKFDGQIIKFCENDMISDKPMQRQFHNSFEDVI